MGLSGRVVLVFLWIASVVLVAALASAQSRQVRPEAAPVISGADIGFRPEGWQGKAADYGLEDSFEARSTSASTANGSRRSPAPPSVRR